MSDNVSEDLRKEIHQLTSWSDKLCTISYLLYVMTEIHYTLRVEHNHSTMTWFAYYAGKDQHSLCDDMDHYWTESDTPADAVARLFIRSMKIDEKFTNLVNENNWPKGGS